MDELQVDSDGFLTNFHGSIEATSYNCTFSVDAITVKDRPLTIRGRF